MFRQFRIASIQGLTLVLTLVVFSLPVLLRSPNQIRAMPRGSPLKGRLGVAARCSQMAALNSRCLART